MASTRRSCCATASRTIRSARDSPTRSWRASTRATASLTTSCTATRRLRAVDRYFESHDIHTLAVRLDDVVDFTEACADQLSVYGVEAPMTQAQEMAEVLVAITDQVYDALHGYRNGGDISSELIEIQRLENEGDRLYRDAVASLFAAGIDPMLVIRWKDIYESLEQAVDACEAVANVMEGITLKRRH